MQRALDVTQYIFQKTGHAFSVVDLDDNRRMQVEIPADCEPVRGLLKAIERGLRLRAAAAARKEKLSADGGRFDERRRYGAPRRVDRDLERDLRREEERRAFSSSPVSDGGESFESVGKEPRYIRKPMLETVEPPVSRVVRREESGRRKGYASQRTRPGVTYYSVGSRGKLPVPAKDEWY